MSVDIGNSSSMAPFLFTGEGGTAVPPNVTHVQVAPSVRVIPDGAFKDCRNLEEVELPEGLQRIGPNAFQSCISLTRINFPSTLKVISKESFRTCLKLVEVHLPDSIKTIESKAFYYCRALERINVPASVTKITPSTFERCIGLVEVGLPKRLTTIGSHSFSSCESLKRIIIPSSVQTISCKAFSWCQRLTEINIPDSLESIGNGALGGCPLEKNFRIPPLVTKIGSDTFSVSRYDSSCWLFSIEIPENLEQIVDRALANTGRLRNVFIPLSCKSGKDVFGLTARRTSSLEEIFQSEFPSQVIVAEKRSIVLTALRHRFDGLHIHKICYFQSYHPTEVVINDLNTTIYPRRQSQRDLRSKFKPDATGKLQDCLGMTPLHILACSTKHNVELYRILIGAYPQALTTKDKWGDLPLLYAFWSGAPRDILHLFGESYRDLFPKYQLDWTRMILTLFDSSAPLTCIQNLIAALQTDFSYQNFDLEEVMLQLAQRWGWHTREKIRDLLLFSVSERLNSLGVKYWQEEIECSIHEVGGGSSVEHLYSKLAFYENLKEAISLLELVLWKAKYDVHLKERSPKKLKIDGSACKVQCRTQCGADIVIPNVLPFLLPKEETLPFESSEEELSLNDSSSDEYTT